MILKGRTWRALTSGERMSALQYLADRTKKEMGAVSMQEALTNCGNPQCNKCIYKGDSVWKHDGKLYCHIQCFLNAKVGVQHGEVRV